MTNNDAESGKKQWVNQKAGRVKQEVALINNGWYTRR